MPWQDKNIIDYRQRGVNKELDQEFYESIQDILHHPVVLKMKDYYQHCQTSCYQHCLSVAYYNFCICKSLNLDAVSAARGGMLHDLFLYDWRHHSKKTGDRFHAMSHPWTAYRNAKKYFEINSVEKEVITKHMWPVTFFPPRHPETYVICFTDKYCGTVEIAKHYSKQWEHFWWGRKFNKMLRLISRKFPRGYELAPELESIENAAIPLSFARQSRRPLSGWGASSGSSEWSS